MLRVANFERQVHLGVRAPFQDAQTPLQNEQVHVWVFIHDFLTDYMRMVQRWAERTRAEVESWVDLSPEGKRDRAMALCSNRNVLRSGCRMTLRASQRCSCWVSGGSASFGPHRQRTRAGSPKVEHVRIGANSNPMATNREKDPCRMKLATGR